MLNTHQEWFALQNTFQSIRENTAAALPLRRLRRQVKPFIESENADIKELAAALLNLFDQLQSGVVAQSTKLQLLLFDVENYLAQNHSLEASTTSPNDLLGRLDYEASGGNIAEPADVIETKPPRKPAKSVDLSEIQLVATADAQDKPAEVIAGGAVPGSTEPRQAKSLVAADELEVVHRIQTMTEIIARKHRDLEAAIPQDLPDASNANGVRNGNLTMQLTQLEGLVASLKTEVKGLTNAVESNTQIKKSKIVKQLSKLLKGVDCQISCTLPAMNRSLWTELKRAISPHLDGYLRRNLREIVLQQKKQTLSIVLRVSINPAGVPSEANSLVNVTEAWLRPLREAFGALGCRVLFQEESTTLQCVTVAMSTKNRIVEVLIGSVGSDSYAIANHQLVKVLPVSKKLKVQRSGELVYESDTFQVTHWSAKATKPSYYALIKQGGKPQAIPFTRVKPNQKLVLRHSSATGTMAYGSALTQTFQICSYPDLSSVPNSPRSIAPQGLRSHVLVLFASPKHAEFVRQISAQYDVAVTSVTSYLAAIATYREFRPKAVLCFQYSSYNELVVHEQSFFDIVASYGTAMGIYRSTDSDTHPTVSLATENLTHLPDDSTLHNFLLAVCETTRQLQNSTA